MGEHRLLSQLLTSEMVRSPCPLLHDLCSQFLRIPSDSIPWKKKVHARQRHLPGTILFHWERLERYEVRPTSRLYGLLLQANVLLLRRARHESFVWGWATALPRLVRCLYIWTVFLCYPCYFHSTYESSSPSDPQLDGAIQTPKKHHRRQNLSGLHHPSLLVYQYGGYFHDCLL